WAMVLVLFLFFSAGSGEAIAYVDSRNYTEPMFVFVIMVIAGTRPILQTARALVRRVARRIPLPGSLGTYLVVMTLVPLLGSFITEPAAMTLGALVLASSLFNRGSSTRLRYASLGLLFVNVSIGGTLTPFAAPPVLMVAGQWGWDVSFMLANFGWKAALAIVVSTLGTVVVFRRELGGLAPSPEPEGRRVPAVLVLLQLAFLAGVVVFAHHPPLFMGIFLLFLGVASAYQRHHDPLILREGLLVAFFLA